MSGDLAARAGFYAALLEDDPATLYEKAPCGYVSTTPDGTILKINETFETWTGWSRQELVGRRTFAELLSTGGRIYHETHIAPMLRMHGSVHEIALDLTARDGRRLPALVNAVLERSAEGAPVVVRIAVFDATERREYERELLAAKRRAEQSEANALALSRALQQTLVPPTPPEIPGLEVAAVYRPAGDGGEIGGDFYDVFQIGTDEWVVTLGDVCGKGVEAAVLTAFVRHSLRGITVRVHDCAEALRELNTVLLRHGSERFCTVVLLRLRRDGQDWQVGLASGGHPPPLLRGVDGHTTQLVAPGSIVGVLDAPDFEGMLLPLSAGETLVLYTDGVSEGRRDGAFYGEQRLMAAVADHEGPLVDLPAAILDDAMAFQGEWPRDDIAVVAVHVPRIVNR